MNQVPVPEKDLAFRISPGFIRGTLRALLILMILAAILGGLALMSVINSPMLNSTGLVLALVALMWAATALFLRRGKSKSTPRHFAKNPAGGRHRVRAATICEQSGARTLVQDLALLAQLHSNHQLTDVEFASLKSKLLGS